MERITWIGSTFVLVGLAALLLVHVALPIEPWRGLLMHLSSVFVGAGLVELVIQTQGVKHLALKVSHGVRDVLNLSLDGFYQKRKDLPDLDEILQGVSTVDCAWPIGSVSAAGSLGHFQPPIGSVVRIVVMHPNCDAIKEVAKIVHPGTKVLSQGVRTLTDEAVRRGFAVKWFKGPIFVSLILTDSTKGSGCAQVEVLTPYTEPLSRLSFRLSKAAAPVAFDTIAESFDTLWKNAVLPDAH